MSIVAPAIDAEVSYRRERIAADFQRARAPRRAEGGNNRRIRRMLSPRAA